MDWTPAEVLEVRDLDTLKIMADARRRKIVDLLRRAPATVKEMAATLQVSPKSLYYHVNLLEKHGLIHVIDTRLVSGIVEKRYRASAYLFNFQNLGYGLDGDSEGGIFEGISSVLTMTSDDLRLGLESGTIRAGDQAPPDERLSMEWNLIRLSPADRDELDRRVCCLLREFAAKDQDAPHIGTYRYLHMVFPTFQRGERPDLPALTGDQGEPS